MSKGLSCHPWEHRTEVMDAVVNLMKKAGDKFHNYELSDYFDAEGIPTTPEVQNCGATIYDLIIRILEECNYLST